MRVLLVDDEPSVECCTICCADARTSLSGA